MVPSSPARIVFDAKRGDIGSTSEAYASSAFEQLRCDSITASPYLGIGE
jgi:orotidine-5'-phosphate decarboxylase